MASWMLSELFAAGGGDVNVNVRGGGGGVFQVTLDGDMVFDKAEVGRTPDLTQAKDIKAILKNRIQDLAAAPAGD